MSTGKTGLQVIRVDPERIEDEQLLPAAKALRHGQLVAFPTETVYGLGANANDPAAVARIFAVKGRPPDNPLIVHLADPDQLSSVARDIPPLALRLLDAFAPGPLTLVLPRAATVPDIVTAGLDTVAVRFPAHPVARRLLQLARVPVAAPSANRSGLPSPTRAWHVLEDLGDRIAFLIDGGPCQYGLESTVLDLSTGRPVILRPGSITAADIAAVAGLPVPTEPTADDADAPRSPGMKYRHYAPRARVLVFQPPASPGEREALAGQILTWTGRGKRAGLFACRASLDGLGTDCIRLDDPAKAVTPLPPGTCVSLAYGPVPDPVAASRRLFDGLRLLDHLACDIIFAEGLPEDGVGLAYMNRLRKASSPAAPVLFVCAGNTCRSPMAAALYNLLREPSAAPGVSAGLAAYPGEPASDGARIALQQDYQISLASHRARRLTDDLMDEAGHILTMTGLQKEALQAARPDLADRIQTLGEAAGRPEADIPDPFDGSILHYQQTAAKLEQLIRAFLEKGG
jgi:L-threonylcarbamoyladenylate synthase